MTTNRKSRANLTDWRTIENDREKYAAYLCSREWSVLKEAVRKRSRGLCERCRVIPQDATHHLTYERKYNERLEDLQAICTPCHDFTHGKSSIDPASNRQALRYIFSCAADARCIVPFELLFGIATISASHLRNELFVIEHIHHLAEIPCHFVDGTQFEDIADKMQAAIGVKFDFLRWLQFGRPTWHPSSKASSDFIARYAVFGDFNEVEDEE